MKKISVIALIIIVSFFQTSYCQLDDYIGWLDENCANRPTDSKETCFNLTPEDDTMNCCASISSEEIKCIAVISTNQTVRDYVENYYKSKLVCKGEDYTEEEEKKEPESEEEEKEENNEEIEDVNQGNELEKNDDEDNVGKWYKLGIIYGLFIFIL